MRTITLAPGEEVRIVCSADGETSSASAPSTNSQESLVGGKSRKGKKTRKANSQAGGKRGPNPFMKFAAKERKNIMSQNPGMPIPEIGKELGKRWRALSEAERSKY